MVPSASLQVVGTVPPPDELVLVLLDEVLVLVLLDEPLLDELLPPQ
jgi:hypothetical protein